MLVYANYFQPSFKMINKKQERASRDQGLQSASHDLGRAILHYSVSAEANTAPAERIATLDPMASLHTIRQAQSALAASVSPEIRTSPRGEILERFLARLLDQWLKEKKQADRKPRVKPQRSWWTRKDSFK